MNTKALAVMAAGHGLLTRIEALDAGMTSTEIAADIRHGVLVVLRRGVYVDARVWADADEYVGRHKLRTRAALKQMSRAWVLSHDSSAHELGLPILIPPDPHVHITRPGTTGAWTKNGVKHHLARFTDEQVVQVGDLRVLDRARTAIDIARELGTPYGEVACDSAMRAGVTRAQFEVALAPMTYWPYKRRTQQAVDFATPHTDSVAETLGRLLVVEALGDQDIETQFPVRLEDGRVVWGDIRVGCHVFEVHGKVKYVPVAEGGLAERSPTELAWADKKRERQLHREGLGTSSIFFADYFADNRQAVLRRIRDEYADTIRQFGPMLPERLQRNALTLRAQRPRSA